MRGLWFSSHSIQWPLDGGRPLAFQEIKPMSASPLPIAIYHEHPNWFLPLFAELDRRGTRYVRIDARAHRFDPSLTEQQFALFFNRMSPSAYLRGATGAVFYTRNLLAYHE